jgi:nucleoside-diphosphate-sugar epimerase
MVARIVVVGARGFVGGHLLRRLAGSHEVWAVARQPGEALPGVRWVTHDLALPRLPDDLPQSADCVIHLAQSSRFREFPEGTEDVLAVNVRSVVQLADWALRSGVGRFIHVSSGGVYGSSHSPISEASPIRIDDGPLSFYLASKVTAEMLLEAYRRHMDVTVLRPFFVYGPGQRADMLMPRLVGRVRQGEAIIVQSPHGARINPIHVDDAVRLIEMAMGRSKTGIVNLAGPEIVTIEQIGRMIGQVLGVEPRFHIQDGPAGHMAADTSHMEAVLGRAAIGIDLGIRTLMSPQF